MRGQSGPPFDFWNKSNQDQGFCECFKDPGYCLATFFCGCCVVGHVQGQLDGNDFNVWSCLCAFIGAFRIRRQVIETFKKTNESVDGSMCAVGVCPLLSICQTAHEASVGLRERANSTIAAPAGLAPPSAPAASGAGKMNNGASAQGRGQATVAAAATVPAVPEAGGSAAANEGDASAEEQPAAQEPTANDRVIIEIKSKLDSKRGSASQPKTMDEEKGE